MTMTLDERIAAIRKRAEELRTAKYNTLALVRRTVDDVESLCRALTVAKAYIAAPYGRGSESALAAIDKELAGESHPQTPPA